jgi:hypothetical protein
MAMQEQHKMMSLLITHRRALQKFQHSLRMLKSLVLMLSTKLSIRLVLGRYFHFLEQVEVLPLLQVLMRLRVL